MYNDLLTQLLSSEKQKLVIQDVAVSHTAIRQGLARSLVVFNQQMALCELPPVAGTLSVTKPNSEGRITIRIRKTGSEAFKFTIVEPTEGESDG